MVYEDQNLIFSRNWAHRHTVLRPRPPRPSPPPLPRPPRRRRPLPRPPRRRRPLRRRLRLPRPRLPRPRPLRTVCQELEKIKLGYVSDF